jgi:hypothetical protein
MMKSTYRFKEHEKAQILPVLVVALIVLIMFAAVIIDGGSIMLNRRTAQAAADAGALAGARELCEPTGADPLVVASTYALMNEAGTVNAQLVDGLVSVNTSVTNNSFFAKIFNEDFLTAEAEAKAGCFAPDGNFLLPIAWSCRPTLGNQAPFDPSLDCKAIMLDWTGLLEPLIEGNTPTIEIPGNTGDFEMDGDDIVEVYSRKPPKQIYLVMDNISVSEESYCKEDLDESDPGYDEALTCDLDGDGKYDIEGGGNRGWLDLDNGGGGTSDMVDWIVNGLDFPISSHTWLSGEPGTVTAVYEAIRDYRRGDVILIPVFNAVCDDSNPTANSACMDAAHAHPRPAEPATGDIDEVGVAPKFHIIAFTPFYVSCVHTFSFDDCPGFTLAQEMNPDPKLPHKSMIPDNTTSIEGFFLTNTSLPLDLENHCSVNLGNCVVSLTQ